LTKGTESLTGRAARYRQNELGTIQQPIYSRMNPLEQHIQRINEKIQQLLKQYRLSQKENEKLRKELADIKALHTERSNLIDELEQKVAILKTATNNMNEEDKKDLEKRLNHYIREIDRCIAILSE
jgi:vacuolar-type H+-ATPase subunit I/STV1